MTRTTESNWPTGWPASRPAGSVQDQTPYEEGEDVKNVVPFNRDRRASARPATAPQTYTPEEVARMLGLSLAGTYNHLRDGDIPARKIGARWIIPKRQFHAWLDAIGDDDQDGETAY
jgi:excisionase family DNA binding protein